MTFWVYFTLFLIFLALSAFFAASETALMSVSLSTWDRLRQNRRRVQTAYELWSENSQLVIATLLFGNTLTSMGATVVTSAMGVYVAQAYNLSTATTLFLVTAFAGTANLIFGDILPKLYARHASAHVVFWTAGLIASVTMFLRPILKGLALLSEVLRKILWFIPVEPMATREDMHHVVNTPKIEGLEPAAHQILSNIMAFDQVKVSEIMIPRNQAIAVQMEQNSERMFERIVRCGFSRVPVYFGNIDNILGIVYAKDLLVEWRSSGLLILEDLLRPPYRIAPDASLSVLLQGFRQGHHLAVVTDSRGRTQGIVTVEDVVEAIVGDIADEFDQPR